MSTADADHILSERVRTSRKMGADSSLVLHGGGNTSAKGTVKDIHGNDVDVLWVKGSGWDLATIEAPGFPACDLKALRALRSVESMDDETMVREVRRTMLDPTGPTPSVETLLHAFLPHRFVDHSHADAIIALSNRPDGDALCKEVFGDRVVYLPWIFPGFPLSKAVADAVDANPDTEGVLLHRHGLFTFGETADEALDKHLELVGLAASRYEDERNAVLAASADADVCPRETLPRLRGAVSKHTPFVFEVRNDPWTLAALAQPEAHDVLVSAPLTPDHTLRCKCLPCWVDPGTDDVSAVVAAYAAEYNAYVKRGIGALRRTHPLRCHAASIARARRRHHWCGDHVPRGSCCGGHCRTHGADQDGRPVDGGLHRVVGARAFRNGVLVTGAGQACGQDASRT